MSSIQELGILQPPGFPPLPSDWETEWETFPSAAGDLQLFGMLHHPKDWKGKRTLVVLHGLAEHGGRYLHFPHFVSSEFDAVYTLDHRGHGRSEGTRGHMTRFDDYADDAALAIRRIQEMLMRRFGSAEIHLLGHSMGGLIAIRTVLAHPDLPLTTLTLSAPFLGEKHPVPPLKKALGKAVAKIWSSIQMPTGLDVRVLAHDQEVGETYAKDRLVHGKSTPGWYLTALSTIENTKTRGREIRLPTLILLPTADEIVDPAPTLAWAPTVKGAQLVKLEGYYHEIFNEGGKATPKERVFEEFLKWIHNRPTK